MYPYITIMKISLDFALLPSWQVMKNIHYLQSLKQFTVLFFFRVSNGAEFADTNSSNIILLNDPFILS